MRTYFKTDANLKLEVKAQKLFWLFWELICKSITVKCYFKPYNIKIVRKSTNNVFLRDQVICLRFALIWKSIIKLSSILFTNPYYQSILANYFEKIFHFKEKQVWAMTRCSIWCEPALLPLFRHCLAISFQ